MWQINTYILTILLYIHSLSSAYDLIVYSATPAGIAAAITAARASAAIKVAIIEPTSYIGGMAVAGGIGLGDINVEETSKLLSVLLALDEGNMRNGSSHFSAWFSCIEMASRLA